MLALLPAGVLTHLPAVLALLHDGALALLPAGALALLPAGALALLPAGALALLPAGALAFARCGTDLASTLGQACLHTLDDRLGKLPLELAHTLGVEDAIKRVHDGALIHVEHFVHHLARARVLGREEGHEDGLLTRWVELMVH